MHHEEIDEALLIKYFLGDLPEEQQLRVEDRAFSDQQYSQIMEAVEADLIDSYVRGELPKSKRQEFERRFLVSPQRRRKLEFARALAEVAAESKANQHASAEVPLTWRDAALDLLRSVSPAFRFVAMATAIIFVIVVGGLIRDTAVMRVRVAELQRQQRMQQTRAEALERKVRDEQTENRLLADQLQREHSHSPASVPTVASLFLFPGISRGGATGAELVVTNTHQLAHIGIQLEPRDEYQLFRVELRTARGERVLTRDGLRAQETKSGRVVRFDVPVSALNKGEYELTLKAVVGPDHAEDVNYYYFTVHKK